MKHPMILLSALLFLSAPGAMSEEDLSSSDLFPAEQVEPYLYGDELNDLEMDSVEQPDAVYQCWARNGRGDFFSANGARPVVVQRRALNRCYAVSRNCRSLGCRRISRW